MYAVLDAGAVGAHSSSEYHATALKYFLRVMPASLTCLLLLLHSFYAMQLM